MHTTKVHHSSPAQSPQQTMPQHVTAHHNNKNGITNGNAGQNIIIDNDEQDQQQFSSLSAIQPTPTQNTKFSLLHFAMQHFRDE